ncbi:MAG: DUF6057 family protein [Candidatus Spyradenecus sp.]
MTDFPHPARRGTRLTAIRDQLTASRYLLTAIRYPLTASLLLAAGVALYWPILYKLGLRACCYADWAGLCEAAADPLPGGVLRWLAHGVMSLWQVPLLGAAVMVALLGGVTALARSTRQLPGAWVLWPAGVLLWQVAYCGFSCWIFVDAAFPCHYALWWSVALGVMAAGVRWGAWGAAGLLFWPVAGLAAPVGVALGACAGQAKPLSRAGRLLAAVLTPFIWHVVAEADPAWRETLLANSPFLFEADSLYWNLASTTIPLLLLALPWLRRLPLTAHRSLFTANRSLFTSHRSLFTSAAAAALLGVAFYRGMDPIHPLYDLLACERAVERDDPAAILKLGPERAVSHRMLSAYTIYALWRTGQLEARLFDYPWRVSHEASTIDTMELDGYRLLFRYGLIQIARRWCYESVINKGWNAEKFELLARAALITEEPELAKRYARQLARLPLCRRKAERLLALAEQRAEPDPELRRLHDLHLRLSLDSGSPVFEGSKKLEEGIYNRYAVLKNGNREMVGLYLCASLLRKDTVPFLENFEVICSVWSQRPLPRAFQQALLDAVAELPPAEQPHLTADLFAPETLQAFDAFRRTLPTLATGRLSPADLLPRFGKSYWFYKRFVH